MDVRQFLERAFPNLSLGEKLRDDTEGEDTLAGTLAYMAPEQTGRMNRGIDARSDLYALGVVLYEALTGQLPFPATDPSDLLHSHLARQAVPPAEVDPAIPSLLSDLVMKLLAKAPEARYQTASGVEADFKRSLDEWEARGSLEAFPLAQADPHDRPVHLKRLYGREKEAQKLLAALHEEGRLGFAPRSDDWAFDLEGIQAKDYTDNVVDLLAGSVKVEPDCLAHDSHFSNIPDTCIPFPRKSGWWK